MKKSYHFDIGIIMYVGFQRNNIKLFKSFEFKLKNPFVMIILALLTQICRALPERIFKYNVTAKGTDFSRILISVIQTTCAE